MAPCIPDEIHQYNKLPLPNLCIDWSSTFASTTQWS